MTTVSGALETLRPDLEYIDLSDNCIDTSKLSTSLISFINDKQATTNPDWASQQNHCKTTSYSVSASTTAPVGGKISILINGKPGDTANIPQ